MGNMELWNEVKQPPSWALKPIQAGRLKGKTDVNPQWRYQVMTEQFGMAGAGWSYGIKKLWTESANDGQMFAFAEVELWTKDAEKPIPGIGGSMLITKEQSGLHASDEGYKMAVTDALSVAMKMLGVGADVYAGLSESKYTKQTTHQTVVQSAKEAGAVEEPAQTTTQTKPQVKTPNDPITAGQVRNINAKLSFMGIEDEFDRHDHVSKVLQLDKTITSFNLLTKGQASKAIDMLRMR